MWAKLILILICVEYGVQDVPLEQRQIPVLRCSIHILGQVTVF